MSGRTTPTTTSLDVLATPVATVSYVRSVADPPLSILLPYVGPSLGKGRSQKKNGIMWEKFPNWGDGSDPNPLLDVYLPSYFWHAKMILRC